MIKKSSMVVRHSSFPRQLFVKPSLTKTLVDRTSKEFDHCAELLRNILSVQESRRNFKSSAVDERKGKKHGQSSINTRTTKKQNSKENISKSSLIKTNINHGSAHPTDIAERRSTMTTLVQEQPIVNKSRISPTKGRKPHGTNTSPKPLHQARLTTTVSKSRGKSPSPSIRSRRHDNRKHLIRSSSCSDLSLKSKKFSFPKSTQQLFFDQLTKYLKQIQSLSGQLRSRTLHSLKDRECVHLWNELDYCLSSALSYMNSDQLNPYSLELIQKQLVALREELKTTNIHLHQYDLNHHHSNRYTHSPKKSDRNSIQTRQLILHNEQLQLKCDDLQMKLEQLERKNLHLIQRLTERDLRVLVEHQCAMTTNNRFLLREEILTLKEKLYHLYDDLTTMINRDRSLRVSMDRQKQETRFYKNRFQKYKQSAQRLLHEIDHRSIEERVKQFFNDFLQEQEQYDYYGVSKNPMKSVQADLNVKPVSHPVPASVGQSSSKVGEKCKHFNRTVFPPTEHSPFGFKRISSSSSSSSSTTIADADSMLTSPQSASFVIQSGKRMSLSNSFPFLNIHPSNGPNQRFSESDGELDQISDLTSKLFTSIDDENDGGFVDQGFSTSSSSSFN